MPLTPVHLGPAVLFGLLAFGRLDLVALAVGSVAVDVWAALVLAGLLDGPVHGPLTTLAGATVVGVVVAAVVVPIRPALDGALARVGLPQPWSLRTVVAGALVGTYSHVVLDAMLYPEVRPLAPLPGNPLYGLVAAPGVYAIAVGAGLLGLGWYLLGRLTPHGPQLPRPEED